MSFGPTPSDFKSSNVKTKAGLMENVKKALFLSNEKNRDSAGKPPMQPRSPKLEKEQSPRLQKSPFREQKSNPLGKFQTRADKLSYQEELEQVKEKLRLKQQEMEDMISGMVDRNKDLATTEGGSPDISPPKKILKRKKKKKGSRNQNASQTRSFYSTRVSTKQSHSNNYGYFIRRAHETKYVTCKEAENGGRFYEQPSIVRNSSRSRTREISAEKRK